MHLEINGWDSGITFSAAHMIPGHNKCSRLHGHIYAINARIHGKVNEDGIIFDFLLVKNALRKIAKDLDHKVLLPKKSGRMKVNVEDDRFKVSLNNKYYEFPKEDVVLLEIKAASAEELARYIHNRIVRELTFPENVSMVEIGVDEGGGEAAWTQGKP